MHDVIYLQLQNHEHLKVLLEQYLPKSLHVSKPESTHMQKPAFSYVAWSSVGTITITESTISEF